MVGFDQRSPHHAHDVFTHTAWVVQRVAPEAVLRLAALLHDVGKPGCFTVDATGRGHFYGHADRSGRMADEILLRLRAPAAVREETVWLIEHHMAFFPPTRKGIRRLLSRHGSGRLMKLNELHRADLLGKDAEDISRELAQLEYVRGLLEQVLAEEGRFSLQDLAVDGHDLMEMGIPAGPAIGTVLNRLLDGVLGEEAANKKQPLLALANDIWTELGQEGQ
jgi:tRNA nucleotidyltransferase (CCA-adding enzyme)